MASYIGIWIYFFIKVFLITVYIHGLYVSMLFNWWIYLSFVSFCDYKYTVERYFRWVKSMVCTAEKVQNFAWEYYEVRK